MKYFFKDPGSIKGLVWIATPENTELEYLSYARIKLPTNEVLVHNNKENESVIVCMSGESFIEVNNEKYFLKKHSAIYIPKETEFKIVALENFDGALFSAPAERKYEVFLADIDKILGGPEKHRIVGGENCKREVIKLIDEEVKADRLLVGVTWTMKGNWSSWPPHEHGALLEEIYVFYDMEEKAFGIQLVYDDFDKVYFSGIVRNGDAVIIPRGYHPNVAAPGFELKYIWAMCARKPREYRVYGKVNIQKGYEKVR